MLAWPCTMWQTKHALSTCSSGGLGMPHPGLLHCHNAINFIAVKVKILKRHQLTYIAEDGTNIAPPVANPNGCLARLPDGV